LFFLVDAVVSLFNNHHPDNERLVVSLQHDEWQGQLLEQDEEEKRLLRLQEEREHRLKQEGWVSLGLVPVNAVANAQVRELWLHLIDITTSFFFFGAPAIR